jgi:hypothetical protein
MVTANLATASIKATGASASRTFGARFAECVSVKDFGATGNGSTDDGPALQAALTFLRKTSSPSSRGLYFPAGNYKTNQVLYITNTEGVRIFGDGSVSTVISYRGSATAGNTEASGGSPNANLMTPVIMTNGFSYSSLSGMSLNSIAGTNTCGIYFYQDATHSKGNTDQLNISDLLVDGGCATGYLVGYQATALCSEIAFFNCVTNSCTGYGWRNVSTNALNNNLYNCGGVLNAVWLSVPTGSVQVYGASLARNTLDIQTGQSPIAITGCRTESLAFVDMTAGQGWATISGCSQIPGDAVTAGFFVKVQNSSHAVLNGNYIGSNITTQGKILGDSYVSLDGNYLQNATPFSGYTGHILNLRGPYTTVASLPAAAAVFKGVRLHVNDASAAASTSNFSSVVAGGGANTVPVWCDGAAWRIG